MNSYISQSFIGIGIISLFTCTSYTLAIPEIQSGERDKTLQIENISDDLYAGAEKIKTTGIISGDAVLAGINILIEKEIEQDALLAGYHIEIKGEVGDDVRIAAHESIISGNVKDDIFAVGKTVELNNSKIGGSIFITGQEVKIINIEAEEGIKITAEKIFFDSNVSGIVNLKASEIEFGENAKINGNLIITAHNITGNNDLKSFVNGEIKKEIIDNKDDKEKSHLFKIISFLGGLLVSIILCSSFLLFILPKFFIKISENIKTNLWSSLGLGWAWFIFVPIISILLLFTFFAFPLGIFFLGIWGLLFLIFPFICSATLAGFFISKCKDAGVIKKIVAIIISSVIIIIPFALVIIAPFVMGSILKEKLTMMKSYK